ncbi:MAG: hypothetical protein MUE40_20415 [Anaerolineae bacterium]|jgi:hypothetical protein|nr:hypothetical protein [Anaerolineae bacterium]
MEPLLVVLVLSAAVVGVGYAAGREARRVRRLLALVYRTQSGVLYTDVPWSPLTRWRVVAPGAQRLPRPADGLLVVTENTLSLYQPQSETLVALATYPLADLRGFWRPQKYQPGTNEMWLHWHHAGTWQVLHVYQERGRMAALVAALKQVATPEQVKAYRRQRPYIHREPAAARPAVQNLQGAWELAAPVMLYLMPLFLVIMQGGQVQRWIDLHQIQFITALPRLDAPPGEGLLRFKDEASGDTLAFAVAEYAAWAEDLAQAAKRTLEEPVFRKQKGKEEEE